MHPALNMPTIEKNKYADRICSISPVKKNSPDSLSSFGIEAADMQPPNWLRIMPILNIPTNEKI